MKYLLILLIFVCGCTYPVEDTMIVQSVRLHDTNYKYLYTIKSDTTRGDKFVMNFVSNQKFSVGDSVKLSLKENENVE